MVFSNICKSVNYEYNKLHNNIFFQLGTWLAVEITDMIEKGVVSYKEKTEA
jgi:hypothetical protein